MQHPDEGTIHAWLDGALSAEESAALAAHVAGCAECAAAVAEARGVLAAASRILSALDTVPGGVIPRPASAESGAVPMVARPSRRGFRVASGRWRAAAAVVVLAGGAWLVSRGTRHDAARESVSVMMSDTSAPVASDAVTSAPAPAAPAPGKGSPKPGRPRARTEVAQRVAAAAPSPEVAGTNEAAPGMVGDVSGIVRGVDTARVARAAQRPDAEKPAAAEKSAADKSAAASVLMDQTFESRRKLALREAPRLVLDRAYVDSVLAADSVAAIVGRPLGTIGGASGGAARANAQTAAAAPSMARKAPVRTDGTIAAATGCWIVDTSAWSPRARNADESEPLLPGRVELRAERGVLGDEMNELLLRPAPGEPPFPVGTAAVWKPIGRDSYRLTVGDASRWVTATVTLDGDSLSGRARDYQGERGPIRTAELSGRRVVCRTEP